MFPPGKWLFVRRRIRCRRSRREVHGGGGRHREERQTWDSLRENAASPLRGCGRQEGGNFVVTTIALNLGTLRTTCRGSREEFHYKSQVGRPALGPRRTENSSRTARAGNRADPALARDHLRKFPTRLRGAGFESSPTGMWAES